MVFDRNSGDFWLVPEITRNILLHLETSGSVRRSDLIARIAAEADALADAGEASRVLDDLLDKGLVVTAPNPRAAR